MNLKNINRAVLCSLMFPAALMIAPQAQALDLTPDDAGAWTSLDTDALQADEVESLVGAPSGSLGLAYKIDVEGGDEDGTATGFYDTTFTFETTGDATGATITQSGMSIIDCPSCYLVVKDGNHQPAQYLFDISGWNGTDDINLSGFWADPAQGAISHIAIWNGDGDGGGGGGGGVVPIPEAETYAMMLAGLGLIGFVVRRRRV